ncbi:hypothetical protein HDU98_005140 [Podochytrium sp. JEL0797]|nr:hypothetical protein HDU98_005140 [Podochytrium sp. JEL0797]
MDIHITSATPTGFDSPLPPRTLTPEEDWLEVKRKKHLAHSVRNIGKENWGDLLRISHSVLPRIFLPALLLASWSALVCVFYLVQGVAFLKTWALPSSTLLVTVLGTAMSLLLAFRLNSAYDRFWEGRKQWSTVHFQLRNLGRFICVFCIPANKTANKSATADEDRQRQLSAMKLLIAFANSTKHALRQESSHRYVDVGPYLQHIPSFAAKIKSTPPSSLPIPLEIAFNLQSYLNQYSGIVFPASSALMALTDALTSFERIRQTPIPAAYSIHLKQTLVVYLLSLPFQLVASPLAWGTVAVCFLTAIVLLGIEVIASTIENPFGYDTMDLPMDEYCDAITQEILQIIDMMHDLTLDDETKDWIAPYSLKQQRIDLSELKAQARAVAQKKVEEEQGRFGLGFGLFVGKEVEVVKGMVGQFVHGVGHLGSR